MSNVKKLMMTAAGGEALNVEDVFSTYLYDGTGSSLTINNGIDLDTEGGMVWIKSRTAAQDNYLFDTERGTYVFVRSNKINLQGSNGQSLTSYNTNGFSLGSYTEVNTLYSSGGVGYDYTSWTFRKAPKFFDVVTYTGDGTSNRQIAHNLGSTPGMVIVKNTQRSSNWATLHKDAGLMFLNSTSAAYSDADTGTQFGDGTNRVDPTSTHFTVASSPNTNQNGEVHVAYLFAHNDGDGEFGPTGDQDIIKCGSGTIDTHVELGWEPQFVLVKATTSAYDWQIFDNMRGMTPAGIVDPDLKPNSSAAEAAQDNLIISSTGFTYTYGPAQPFIYIAIRRGPMAVPESATDVFDVDLANPGSSTITTPFPVDLSLGANRAGSAVNFSAIDRLRGGKGLRTNATDAEQNITVTLDSMDSFSNAIFGSGDHLFYSWKRAPSFFDAVIYTGNGTAGLTVSHNLGVAPEMMIVKGRSNTNLWGVYHSALGATKYLRLDTTAAEGTATSVWNDTEPTATQFTLGSSGALNTNGVSHIAYLFASLDGVSKVGSFVASNGLNVDCGFSNGARFVLLKNTEISQSWMVVDTERGLVTGNENVLDLDNAGAEYSTDIIDPYSAGFSVAGLTSGDTYIFYAIA